MGFKSHCQPATGSQVIERHKDKKVIEIAWIPLRVDGSVESAQPKFKGTVHPSLPVVLGKNQQGFKVIDLRDGMILLEWEDKKLTGEKVWHPNSTEEKTTAAKPAGKLGVVLPDGSMPQPAAWKDVVFEFSTPITDNVTNSYFSGVFVPKDFAP